MIIPNISFVEKLLLKHQAKSMIYRKMPLLNLVTLCFRYFDTNVGNLGQPAFLVSGKPYYCHSLCLGHYRGIKEVEMAMRTSPLRP